MSRFYRWIPSLYFFQALPFALVTMVAPIFYKNFNLSNTEITFITSLFALPWILKPLLSPILEQLRSKKRLTVIFEGLISFFIILLSLSLFFVNNILLSGIIFAIIALFSAIHDISSDGVYIINLTSTFLQAQFVGVRTLAYQLGKLVCHGGLVFLVGLLLHHLSLKHSWFLMLMVLALITLSLTLYHAKFIPEFEKNKLFAKPNFQEIITTFQHVAAEFLLVKDIVLHSLFILLFNFPEAQLSKVTPLFLLDSFANGGLALTTEKVGFIYGGLGTVSVMIGVMGAGFLLSKLKLKNCLLPVTLFILLANISYVVLSVIHPTNLFIITILIILTQLAYGLSNGVYMVYILNTFSSCKYPMSLYAIGTALMALGVVLAGSFSGYLQFLLGYSGFFIWILLANTGTMFLSWFNARRL